MKFVKITAVAAAIAVSAVLAAHFTREHINEVHEREKSLAEIILGNEAAAALENEAEKVEESLQTAVTEITTTVTEEPVETTTAVIPANTEVPEIPINTTASIEEEQENIVTDYQIGGLIDLNNPPENVISILALTSEQQALLSNYLIDHYFLDGFIFAQNEENPAVRERKYAAAEMESAAVQTVNMIMSTIDISNPMNIFNTDFADLIKKVTEIRVGFAANYGKESIEDDDLQKLYDGSIAYFDNLIASLEKINTAATDYKNSSNALLAASLAAKSLTETIIPESMNILEGSFDLVEASQPIFLENTVGHTLLTRDEVKAILSNPAYIIQ
ncbi:MAG: hypothetical protein LBL98_04010 [Ruminococcus sp.]|jgi:hypothetical protein|nr:hypothetical protein [Ruminococcus sp.]